MKRLILCIVLLFIGSVASAAESYEVAGGAYRAMREVDAPSPRTPVVVTQFMHQGMINLSTRGVDPREENAGKTVMVTTKAKKPVPFKILQLGPGDFCRIAIQTDEKTAAFTVYYGVPEGKQPNKNVALIPWTSDAGLLLETRWVDNAFNMDTVEQLKKAFERAKPAGADYVRNVMHGFNPMSFRRDPFLSRYSGNLYVTTPGTYALITSSHQASFVVIDGKVAAEQAGRRGRAWDARPELVKKMSLTEGKHSFEYYHATGDSNSNMMLVWEHNPGEKMQKPVLVPPEVFKSDQVSRAPAGGLTLADSPGAPDFEYRIQGNVPLPDNDQQLIGVQFANKTSTGIAARGKLRWNFGDGQTSEETNPAHVYLKPGIYSVELTSESGDHTFSAVNRIEVDLPHTLNSEKEKLPTLENYLTILEKYDASKLDPDAMLQLIEAYQAKIDRILNPKPGEIPSVGDDEEEKDDKKAKEKGKSDKAATPTAGKRRTTAAEYESVAKYRRLIAETIRSALVENPNFKGEMAVHKLALLGGSIARDYLLDWKLAGQIYAAAAKKLTVDDLSGECSALAADVALEMQNKSAAKAMLDTAEKKIPKQGTGTPQSTFHRVKAEYLAEDGKGDAARKEIEAAAKSTGSGMHFAEKIALQGSASRSAENFIREAAKLGAEKGKEKERDKDLDRAIDELRTWQREYPAAIFDGYITLLFAKYWTAREKYPLAASLADRQITINPDSPYIDELLLVASEAQGKAGNKAAAKSYLNSLIKNYPGSPLVGEAKEQLKKLE